MTYITYYETLQKRAKRRYAEPVQLFSAEDELKRIYDEFKENKVSKREYTRNINEYNDYLNGKLQKATYEKQVEMKIFDTLIELGFSLDHIGTFFYKELILEIAKSLNKENTYGQEICDEQTLREMLMNRYSAIYIEKAKYSLNISSDAYHKQIKDAIKNIDTTKVNKELLVEIFAGYENNTSYQEQAICIGKYIQNKYLKETKTLEMLMA